MSWSSIYHAVNICVMRKFYQECIFFKFTFRELKGIVTIIGWHQSSGNPTKNNNGAVWDALFFFTHNGLENPLSFF